MTQLLEKVIREISELPVSGHDIITTIILDELLDEKQWDTAFARSQDKLSKLADKVRRDISEGRIRKMGIE
jgi:hypothetical protein